MDMVFGHCHLNDTDSLTYFGSEMETIVFLQPTVTLIICILHVYPNL